MHQFVSQDVVDGARREENSAPVHVDAAPAGTPAISEVAHLHGRGSDANPRSKRLHAVLKPGATVPGIPLDEEFPTTVALRAQQQEAPLLQMQWWLRHAGRVDELEPVRAALPLPANCLVAPVPAIALQRPARAASACGSTHKQEARPDGGGRALRDSHP